MEYSTVTAPARWNRRGLADGSTVDRSLEETAFAHRAWGIATFLALVFLAVVVFTNSTDSFWVPEAGAIETATVVCYAGCVAYILLRGRLPFLRRHPAVPILILTCMARELDLHKRFTGVGIFKLRFFTDNTLSPTTKLAGVLVVLSLAAICLHTLRKYWSAYWAGLRRRTPIAIGVTVIGGLIVISKSVDGLDRNLASFGVHLSAAANHVACAAEEIMELGIPLFSLLVLQFVFMNSRFRHDLPVQSS